MRRIRILWNGEAFPQLVSHETWVGLTVRGQSISGINSFLSSREFYTVFRVTVMFSECFR